MCLLLRMTPDQELATLLAYPDMQVAFQDYDSWTDDDEIKLINFIKFQRMKRNKDIDI